MFHTERSADSLQNIQNDLPILTEYDKKVIRAISKEIEIDFLSLSFVREGEDLNVARVFLESIGATTTKVLTLTWPHASACMRSPRFWQWQLRVMAFQLGTQALLGLKGYSAAIMLCCGSFHMGHRQH